MAEPDRIRICSDALVLLGDLGIDSLVGVGIGKDLARSRYGPVTRMLLAAHPWDFCKRVAPLNRRDDAPPLAVAFSSTYQLPSDMLRFIRPLIGTDAVDDWIILGHDLYLDADVSDVVSAEYNAPTDEGEWPPAFREAIVYRLAAEWCVPVREDPKAQPAWMQLADHQLRLAKFAHAQQAPRPPLRTGALARLRLR